MPERSRDMPNAIRFHKSGGPEVLVWEPAPISKPGPGEARVRHTAVGVNFVDIYIRTGLYPAALPSGLGTEAAGVVEEVDPGVDHIRGGRSRRVCRRPVRGLQRGARHAGRPAGGATARY